MDAMVAQEDDVFEAMKDVVDPELGINVVDLGLVYGVSVEEGNIATIDMTLTSAACPLTDVTSSQAGSPKNVVTSLAPNILPMSGPVPLSL